MTIPENPKPGDRWMTSDGHFWTVWQAGETNKHGFRYDHVRAMGLAEPDARLLVEGRELLREMEWGDYCEELGSREACPICGRLSRTGHKPNCRLAAALEDK